MGCAAFLAKLWFTAATESDGSLIQARKTTFMAQKQQKLRGGERNGTAEGT
jgi:hypothetical protein